jgi:4-hydroxy-tetrahydrodipicolinate reductase
MNPSRLAQLGLGPIGLECLRLAATKPWARVVGAVDLDPAKAGQSVRQLTGVAMPGDLRVYGSLEELLRQAKPEVILHTAASHFRVAYPDLLTMVRAGVHVVSSCEELIFPALKHAARAARLDQAAQATGARVVAAGVNPGFVMDLLPLCLTGVVQGVRAVEVHRVVNAATRREPLQRKIGSGLAPQVFLRQVRAGEMGHAGLSESVALLAHGLGWRIGRIRERCEPIVAEREIRTAYFTVRPGLTCGLHARAEARTRRGETLCLDLRMYLDAPQPHDLIRVAGTPPLEVRVERGVAGDPATVAALLNAVPALRAVPPGLRLLTELPVPRSA